MGHETDGTSYERGLKNLVESVPGAFSANLTGRDGIGIASYLSREAVPSQGPAVADLSLIDAEFATMLTTVSRSLKNIEAGEVDEMVFSSDRATYLLKMVGGDFFLALGLATGRSNLGMARLRLRWAAREFSRLLL